MLLTFRVRREKNNNKRLVNIPLDLGFDILAAMSEQQHGQNDNEQVINSSVCNWLKQRFYDNVGFRKLFEILLFFNKLRAY